jgi:hypothetical protein
MPLAKTTDKFLPRRYEGIMKKHEKEGCLGLFLYLFIFFGLWWITNLFVDNVNISMVIANAILFCAYLIYHLKYL